MVRFQGREDGGKEPHYPILENPHCPGNFPLTHSPLSQEEKAPITQGQQAPNAQETSPLPIPVIPKGKAAPFARRKDSNAMRLRGHREPTNTDASPQASFHRPIG